MIAMRRSVAIILTGGLLLLGSLALAVGSAAATIGSTTTCNNALGNGGAVCEVTVVNTVTTTGGSALVTVRECQGSAGVPDATCTNTTTALAEPVTAVTQCDGSINGGGGTLRCSVVVTNNYVGMSPVVTPVTVNQCVGSSDMGSVLNCSPFPATTIGATITQCNGSANGGGTRTVCSAQVSSVIGGPTPSMPNAAMSSPRAGPGAANLFLGGSLVLLIVLSLTALRRSTVR
jgi:hypothetical protein